MTSKYLIERYIISSSSRFPEALCIGEATQTTRLSLLL